MIAHFYLMAESFENNSNYSTAEIEEKIMRLAEDVKLINNDKSSNKFYTNYSDLFPQSFYSNYTVEDFICKPSDLKANGVSRDVLNAMQSIIEKSTETNITSKEVLEELLDWNDNENCHGLIAFHRIERLNDNFQIVYGIDGWYKFRRYFLGQYPKNGSFFINECTKYFPSLYFHERNKGTVESILTTSANRIVHHLSELSDKFNSCRTTPYTRIETLRIFNSSCALDQKASPEGNIKRKAALSWNFVNTFKLEELMYCEIHLKLLYDDNGKVSTDRRIYFHEGKQSIQQGKILVGHIGNHL